MQSGRVFAIVRAMRLTTKEQLFSRFFFPLTFLRAAKFRLMKPLRGKTRQGGQKIDGEQEQTPLYGIV